MLSQRGLITEQITFVLHPSLCLLDWFLSTKFWLSTTQQSLRPPTTPLSLASNLKIFTAEQKRVCLVISNSESKHISYSLYHWLACSSFSTSLYCELQTQVHIPRPWWVRSCPFHMYKCPFLFLSYKTPFLWEFVFMHDVFVVWRMGTESWVFELNRLAFGKFWMPIAFRVQRYVRENCGLCGV